MEEKTSTKETSKKETSTKKSPTPSSSEGSVYFFIPNLIGYFRVITMFLSFVVCYDDPVIFFILYFLSAFSDSLDGHYARKYGQESSFGAVLDMVTDRCSTTGLIMVLSRFYPDFSFLWITIVVIDMFSHYAHMYSSLSKGKHHKVVDNPLLALYYKKQYLFTLCAGNEAMFLAFYILHFTDNIFAKSFLYISLPFGLFKQFLNVIQLFQAFIDLNKMDIVTRRLKKEQEKEKQEKEN